MPFFFFLNKGQNIYRMHMYRPKAYNTIGKVNEHWMLRELIVLIREQTLNCLKRVLEDKEQTVCVENRMLLAKMAQGFYRPWKVSNVFHMKWWIVQVFMVVSVQVLSARTLSGMERWTV